MSSFLKTSFIHDKTAPSGSLVLLLKRSFSRQHHLHFFLVFSQVPRLSPRIVCFALGLLQRQTGIAGNVSIYKLLITVGWRTVWTRFSDNRFSKKVQLSRHRGPHRTKKNFSHAICLCLVRVRKVHVLYIARVQSCSRALWRSGLGRRATAPALHDHERDEMVEPCPAPPMPRALCEGLAGSPTVDLRGQLIGVWAVTKRDACARSKLRKFLRNQFSFFVKMCDLWFSIRNQRYPLPPFRNALRLEKKTANLWDAPFSPLPLTHTRTQNLVWVPWCDSRNRASQYPIDRSCLMAEKSRHSASRIARLKKTKTGWEWHEERESERREDRVTKRGRTRKTIRCYQSKQ